MDALRVLVVDDEAPARKRLADLVEQTEGVVLLDTCADGRAAIEHILRDEPALVFLDVQMPEIDGLEVVRLVGPDRMPAVVFVTAYDQYALKAFELAAVDYLLKPFSDERFRQAVARATEHVRHHSFDELSDRMMGLLRSVNPVERSERAPAEAADDERPVEDGTAPPRALERIAVQRRNEIELVPVADVFYFEADGTYVNVHTDERSHLIRERMKTLEKRLSPAHFCRIHRSTIVNLDRVEALESTDPGDIVARLTNGRRLRVSRSRRPTLEERLGL
jgi:two-component system LytT family response regulator